MGGGDGLLAGLLDSFSLFLKCLLSNLPFLPEIPTMVSISVWQVIPLGRQGEVIHSGINNKEIL